MTEEQLSEHRKRVMKRNAFLAQMVHLAKQYVQTGEEQDGVEYWDKLPDLDSATKDFALYLQNI